MQEQSLRSFPNAYQSDILMSALLMLCRITLQSSVSHLVEHAKGDYDAQIDLEKSVHPGISGLADSASSMQAAR